mmetsp:Transcript_16215/g.19188  ORF Transcript_16215/g.19188 Transcript_16215/m.19188 type:complete len:281 (+) Transcript_16215:42-884(+)
MTPYSHHYCVALFLLLSACVFSPTSSFQATNKTPSLSLVADKDCVRCHAIPLRLNTLQDDSSQQRCRKSDSHTLVLNDNSSRRALIRDIALTLVGSNSLPLPSAALTTSIAKSRSEGYAIQHTEKEWVSLLSSPQYNILRKGGTERQRSSILDLEERAGVFFCAGCSTSLFSSTAKFKSGTGWPSFSAAIVDNALEVQSGGGGSEVRCYTCGGHLGDVFNDGWRFVGTSASKTGKRFCIDGSALVFKPTSGEKDVRGDMPPPNKVIMYEQPTYREQSTAT